MKSGQLHSLVVLVNTKLTQLVVVVKNSTHAPYATRRALDASVAPIPIPDRVLPALPMHASLLRPLLLTGLTSRLTSSLTHILIPHSLHLRHTTYTHLARLGHLHRPTSIMPPKRAASSKRKAEPPSDSPEEFEEESQSDASSVHSDSPPAAEKRKTAAQPKAKPKAKAGAGAGAGKGKGKGKATATKAQAKSKEKDADTNAFPDPDAQPTNKVLPEHIAFAPKAEGTVRIATWNICGLAAAQKKVRPSV